MDKKHNQYGYKTITFSKDNPIIKISTKQSQIQEQNITPPSMPKESTKE